MIYFSLGVLGIGALIQMSSLMPSLDALLPNGMQRIDTGNEKQMKEVFFGGNPWLIFCTNKTVPDAKITKLLTKTRKKLGDEFSLGVLDCTNKLPSGNTIFERFKIKPSKSSQALVLAVNGKTKQIPKEKATTASALKAFVKKKSKVRVANVRKQKAWEKYCMNQRVCGALVVGTYEDRTIQNLANLHRGVQFVVVNASYYKLEDSQGKAFTGSNPKGDSVLHLFKRRKGGLLSTSSYSGPFTSHNMGKFVAAHMGNGDPSAGNEDVLLKKNERPELVSKRRKKKPRKKTKKDKLKEAQAKKDAEAAKAERPKVRQARREQRRRARMDKEAESYIPQAEEEDEVELKDDEGDDDDSPAAGSGGGGATAAAAADAGDGEEVDLDGDDDGDDGEEMDLDDDDGEEMDLDDD